MSRRLSVVVAFVVAVGVVFSAAQITSGSTNSTKETVFVGLVPTRLLDTRENATTFDGFDQAVGRLDADTTYELDIASRAGIPIDAASVTANFVAANPSGPGYLTVYPCSVDRPLAAAVNYRPGEDIGNEFTVPLGPDGDICLYTFAETDLVVDVSGYYITSSGGTGEQGPKGDPGEDAYSPARVIWVADDGTGDYTLLSDALDSIDDNTATKPYVIKIAPGTYTEEANVAMKNYVDVEGSGQDITTINCDCSSSSGGAASSTISIGEVNAEIRQITIENSNSTNSNFAVHSNQNLNTALDVTMTDVTATATGGTAVGIELNQSTLKLRNVTATGQSGNFNYGIRSTNSFVTIETTKATASGGTGNDLGINAGIFIQTAPEPLRAQLNNVIAEAYCDNCSEMAGVYASNARLIANNVTATAEGSELAIGIRAESFSVVNVSNSTAVGIEADDNYGISVRGGSSATVNDITATGASTTGKNSYGIEVAGMGSSSTLNAFNTKAVGEAGDAGVAAVVDGTGTTASFANSVLDGESLNLGKSIWLVEGGAAKVVNTRFEPSTLVASNDLTCLNTYYLDLSKADTDC